MALDFCPGISNAMVVLGTICAKIVGIGMGPMHALHTCCLNKDLRFCQDQDAVSTECF